MQAILIRIGADHSYGKWNAPVCPDSLRFFYLPIPEGPKAKLNGHLNRQFDEFVEPLRSFADSVNKNTDSISIPTKLLGTAVHLDPDFEHLTYGDNGANRGSRIKSFVRDDLIVFYAGLKPIKSYREKLIYALVGVLQVDEVVSIVEVPEARWHENAHTRKSTRGEDDIIVRGNSVFSGRFDRCIPIGEFRDRAYRVRRELLEAWGGLDVKDGFIQRSVRPPMFHDAVRFKKWLVGQNRSLSRSNNPF